MSDKLRGGTTIGGFTALHMGNIDAVISKLEGGFASADHSHGEAYAAKSHSHSGYLATPVVIRNHEMIKKTPV